MITLLTPSTLQSKDAQAIAELDHQLNPNRTPLPLTEILDTPTTYLFVYREQQQIVGMATLIGYRVISGYKGWIEDVVVDQAHRGRGIGKQLMVAILKQARALQLQQLFCIPRKKNKSPFRCTNN